MSPPSKPPSAPPRKPEPPSEPVLAGMEALKGVGPARAKLLAELAGGPRAADLLWLLPASFIDRSYTAPLAEAEEGRIGTFRVEVERLIAPRRPRAPWLIWCRDEAGDYLQLIYFRGAGDWLRSRYRPGARLAVSGKLERQGQTLRMVHPDRVEPAEALARLQDPEPVYPLTRGLTQYQVREAVRAALDLAPSPREWLPLPPSGGQKAAKTLQEAGRKAAGAVKAGKARTAASGPSAPASAPPPPPELPAPFPPLASLPSWREALEAVHLPEQGDTAAASLSPLAPSRLRLALDELFAHQVALALARAKRGSEGHAQAVPWQESRLVAEACESWPFQLTGAQKRALGEINSDMAGPVRMARLLQGDVGSGKTVVALLAALTAIEHGGQAALMAPTEVLARQHHETLSPTLQRLGIGHELLLGGERAGERRLQRQRLASGASGFAVGTHALLSEGVEFRNLALAVVDEQHRFGVRQRAALVGKGPGKGRRTDVLVMSATPIRAAC